MFQVTILRHVEAPTHEAALTDTLESLDEGDASFYVSKRHDARSYEVYDGVMRWDEQDSAIPEFAWL